MALRLAVLRSPNYTTFTIIYGPKSRELNITAKSLFAREGGRKPEVIIHREVLRPQIGAETGGFDAVPRISLVQASPHGQRIDKRLATV